MKRGTPRLHAETLTRSSKAEVVRGMKDSPVWICFDCGHRYGRGMPQGHVCTTHEGVCDVCGQSKRVTELRDFGGLRADWRQA